MSDRLTVHITAEALTEGALDRARKEARRYFGDRPSRIVETRSEGNGVGFFFLAVTFEGEDNHPSVRCGVLDHATLSVCARQPHAESEPHIASSGRHFFA